MVHIRWYRVHGIWVAVKIMVPFWVLAIIRHLVFGDPKGDHNFDNHAYTLYTLHYIIYHRSHQGLSVYSYNII